MLVLPLHCQGLHFTGTTAVSFGGTPANSFTVVSDSVIQALVVTGSSGSINITNVYGNSNGGSSSSGFVFTTLPTITTFSPTSGPVGTIVKINGVNFGSSPTANTVYLGAVNATVTNASSTSLTVAVPVGAGYSPFTLSASNLTTSTLKPFVITFPGDTSFGANSFATKLDFGTGDLAYGVTTGDFDGDGKPDIVVANYGDNTVSVLRNTSTNGNISFAAKIDFTTGTGPKKVATGDFDGDSKLDIAAADLDGDGRPEIIITHTPDATVPTGLIYVLRNTSSPGSITFTVVAYNLSYNMEDIAMADIDGDSKTDFVFVDNTNHKIYVMKNLSTTGSINFAPIVQFAGNANEIKIADLNGDGKPDVADAGVQVFKNSSNAGVIQLSPFVSYAGGFCICLNDMDLDGKPDIIYTNLFGQSVSVLRNKVGPNLMQMCPPAVNSGSIVSNVSGGTYQWQLDAGAGFSNIVDNSNYTGVNNPTLQLSAIPSAWYGYKFRCLVDGNIYSDTIELRFRNIWTGVVSTQWDNPANWSCGTVPDINTDVVINNGSLIINSNVTIRSLQLSPNVSLTVNNGYTLTITH